MRILTASLLIILSWASLALAQCGGKDLRPSLSAEQNSEITARTTGMPYPQGNHWIARNSKQTLHIIGTIHIHYPRLDAVTTTLAPVIKAADLILLEATPAEEKAVEAAPATRPDMMFITSGPSLIDRLSATEWADLSDAAQARGIPPFMAAKMQPWYLSLILGLPPCLLQQVSKGVRGLDHQIIDIADAAGVPMAALEPWDTLFTIFGQDPLEHQLEMLRLSLLPIPVIEDAVATLTNQYFEQDHGAVMETSRLLTRDALQMPAAKFDPLFDDMLDGLLVQRNLAWMNVIASQNADVIVIAVGAGHLPGEQGVLNLLAQAGYTLTRASF